MTSKHTLGTELNHYRNPVICFQHHAVLCKTVTMAAKVVFAGLDLYFGKQVYVCLGTNVLQFYVFHSLQTQRTKL